MQKVDNFKFKLKNFKENLNLLKQPCQIPQMGFSENHNVSLVPDSYLNSYRRDEQDEAIPKEKSSSDQEILENVEAIYFSENVDTSIHELKKLSKGGKAFDVSEIEQNINILKSQQKVISKKVLQMILEKRNECNEEFQSINETKKRVQESVWTCQKARSYLNYSKQHLSTSSLEILAAYKKRQTLLDLLEILKFFQEMKSTNQRIQDLLQNGSYSEAISLLLQQKNQSEKFSEFTCTESLKQNLKDSLDLSEVTLDNALNCLSQKFDPKVYSELLQAYKLLDKTQLAQDLLHMDFISLIHSTAFVVIKENLGQLPSEQKLLFEQMCESLTIGNLVPCLTQLSKKFWTILVCYYQVKHWHQNYKLCKPTQPTEEANNEEYLIQEKIKKGQVRIWNDIQAKICIFISSTKLNQLKYENFIQILSIVQRLKRVGQEFCDDNSTKMIDIMNTQSIEFFKRYHVSCLDEVHLFIEHEVWAQVSSFSCVTQLQEFRLFKRALKRHIQSGETTMLPVNSNSPSKRSRDDSSVNSSLYGSCVGMGFFARYSEKSSPFENLFDQKMIEEDFLAGIADETSCYYSEDSEEDQTDASDEKSQSALTINNTSLNILRIIGRYLKMCRLLNGISEYITHCMTELIDLYIYAIYEMFSKDLAVPGDALHSEELISNLKRISRTVISKMRNWPPSMFMIEADLKDSEKFFALSKRINAVESCQSIINQFSFIYGYLDHLIETMKQGSNEKGDHESRSLKPYIETTQKCIKCIRKLICMSVTSRAIDIQATILAINKVKWDISHVMIQHSSYVDVLNRATQIFACRLEELSQSMSLPTESLWESYCHVVSHVLVEGYSNAKKCSAAGRALMQLDFTHFLSVLEVLSGMKHPVHQQYVDQYLKAFYLGSSLEDFISMNKNYSNKHLTGLIQCACNDKKMRQKLLIFVESSGDS